MASSDQSIPRRSLILAQRPARADVTPLLHDLAAAARADLAVLFRCTGAPMELTVHAANVALAPAAAAALTAWAAAGGWPCAGYAAVGDAATPFPGGAALLQPLATPEAFRGVLLLARSSAEPFGPTEQLLAELAADREAVALQRDDAQTQAFQESQLLDRLLDSIPSSLLVIDARLRVVAVNRNFLEKARRSARTTLGRHVSEVFPTVLARYIRMPEKVAEVFQSGLPMRGERLAFRAPGLPKRIFFYQLIPLGSAGQVERVLLLLDDITERERLGEEARRAERYLASLVECAGDLVASLDREGRIVTWNGAAEALSGRSAESVLGMPLPALCAPEHRPALEQLLAALTTDTAGGEVEAALLQGAARLPIAWRGAPMRDDHGHVVALVVVGRDLTERRQLELQLIQSAKSASLGVMAGGIAHEIRNPLGIITAMAHLLREEACSNAFHGQCAERIERAVQRAATIIEDLLTFARPDQSPPRRIDLNGLLDETLALLSHQPGMRRIAVIRELLPDLPLILGRPGLLQQVFTNLLLNAYQAMPDGGTLRITTRRAPEGGVAICIRDTGSGIAPDILPRIFDPFFTTKPTGQGIGLGLAICASIVAQHGGAVSVESAVAVGSAFTVWLPEEPAVNGSLEA